MKIVKGRMFLGRHNDANKCCGRPKPWIAAPSCLFVKVGFSSRVYVAWQCSPTRLTFPTLPPELKIHSQFGKPHKAVAFSRLV